jgi:hypothetical protein
MGVKRGMHPGFLWESHKERRRAGRPTRRWKVNIKMDLREIRPGGTDWIDLAHDRD